MSKFDVFVGGVLDGTRSLAKDLVDDLQQQSRADAQAFLDKTQADLQRWTGLLANGQLSEMDFSDLVHAKKALAEIHALTQAGIAATKLERFRSGLVDLVIDTAFKVFL